MAVICSEVRAPTLLAISSSHCEVDKGKHTVLQPMNLRLHFKVNSSTCMPWLHGRR